ncbi:MAG: polysaccharide biosynthesis protein [Ruminococcus sp.]|nr:polysaccharide biosynthesis protein [Ruminococcus sp.]MDY4908626.1 nucleoside-diphosphate sugar epimerase/dehydratase [Candidatus Fimenecus sp.]
MKTKKPSNLGAKRFGRRNLAFLLADIVIVNLVYFVTTITYWIFRVDSALIKQLSVRIPYVTLIYILCYAIFRVYQTAWRYAGLADMVKYSISAGVGTCGVWVCDYVFMKTNRHLMANGTANTLYFNVLPKTVYLDSLLIIILCCLAMRLASRSYLMFKHERNRKMHLAEMKQILIIGAGEAGTSLIRDFENNSYKFGNPAALIDDDKSKIGLLVNGVPVVGNCDDIERVCANYSIDEIIFCIPSITDDRKREILNCAIKTGIPVKIAPDIADLENSRISYKEMRSVDILDLLSRPEIKLNPDVCKYVTGKTVLVTGGGGSIGSELCRQIARYNPEKIVIFDIYENNAYALKNSLDRHYFGNPKIEIRIGSVREYARLKEIFEEFHPSSVFHAAAHKHVPLMEDSPYEAIKNNVLGTYNTAKCANEYGVDNFVLLSTDKAVNPTNVMGATKRCCELIIQHFSKISTHTKFAAVRFGNVLGSNGSVIPLFKEQLKKGGPLTVTHPDITRYFMTIPEAAQLVVQAGGLAKGGEIFVLDMGEPVKIVSLAEKLIKLSGFEPYVDIDIQFTGLRPGEKLYEELILPSEKEGMRKTENNKIFITAPTDFDDDVLLEHINSIPTMDPSKAREFLKELVPNFKEY